MKQARNDESPASIATKIASFRPRAPRINAGAKAPMLINTIAITMTRTALRAERFAGAEEAEVAEPSGAEAMDESEQVLAGFGISRADDHDCEGKPSPITPARLLAKVADKWERSQ